MKESTCSQTSRMAGLANVWITVEAVGRPQREDFWAERKLKSVWPTR